MSWKGLVEEREILTERRTSTPDKYGFRRLEWHLLRGKRIQSESENSGPEAYEVSGLAKDTGKRMNDLDNGAKAVDQLAIFVPIVVECRFSF
jgi:hypothetical protein